MTNNPFWQTAAVVAIVGILGAVGRRFIPATWKALVLVVVLTLVIMWLLERYM
jgi:hypothetical protein